MSGFYGQKSNVQVKASDRSAKSDSKVFAPIAPGFYVAKVTGASEGTFLASFKGAPGRWLYLKLTPEFVLLNENGTTINRQDWIVGVIGKEGDDPGNRQLIRPDNDEGKPALFAQTAFLLDALGFVDSEENVALDQFHPTLVNGQHVLVKVENRPYTAKDGEERLKNEIVNVYALKQADIDRHGLYEAPNGMVFETDEDYYTWTEILEDLMYGSENY